FGYNFQLVIKADPPLLPKIQPPLKSCPSNRQAPNRTPDRPPGPPCDKPTRARAPMREQARAPDW
ncbi:MAG: hypothetical protein PHD17_02120, partial [Methanothrix soehngenii]|nr:hypothetical protein [Methanothrix soehngenii]